MKVLIVEDDIRLADALEQILGEAGYETHAAHDGDTGLFDAMSSDYDVIVLDIMLPGRDGFEIIRSVRTQDRHTPIIMLTARDQVNDKIRALDCGADDYMTKPFVPEELMARLRALTRRSTDEFSNSIVLENTELNLDTHMLCCGDKSIHLGYKEFEILRLLFNNPKIYLSKESIINKVWGNESDAEDNNVEAYISFLRKKLAHIGSELTIASVRKVGYRPEKIPDASSGKP